MKFVNKKWVIDYLNRYDTSIQYVILKDIIITLGSKYYETCEFQSGIHPSVDLYKSFVLFYRNGFGNLYSIIRTDNDDRVFILPSTILDVCNEINFAFWESFVYGATRACHRQIIIRRRRKRKLSLNESGY